MTFITSIGGELETEQSSNIEILINESDEALVFKCTSTESATLVITDTFGMWG